MALEKHYLEYPRRRYGMDHDRYSWSMLKDRPAIDWGKGRHLALWVNTCVQFYPLNQRSKPFAVPGGMTMPYPDLRHYTLRDYGNRIGIYRLLDAFAKYEVHSSFAVNAVVAERSPQLLHELCQSGEIIAHGLHMDALHYGAQCENEERQLIRQTLDLLGDKVSKPIRGWLSPARSESEITPDLLSDAGLTFFSDWVNDDMPYAFKTSRGKLWAMPLSQELEDYFILGNNLHSEQSWLEQVVDACDFLLEEAQRSGSGRILALNLHPWLMGQPHRIAKLEQALKTITEREGVFSAQPTELLECFVKQQKAEAH